MNKILQKCFPPGNLVIFRISDAVVWYIGFV